MARPPKDPALRLTDQLRIPLSADQKQLIIEAAKIDSIDMTAWARAALLQAAKGVLAGKQNAQSEPDGLSTV